MSDTPYKQAWEAFQATDEYRDLMRVMCEGEPNTERRFIVNRIKIAFAAGWNAFSDAILADAKKDGLVK
jgi:hypothetical protein